MSPHDVVIRPLVTEKGHRLAAQGQYMFQVHPDANKIEIRQAVETIFKVHVTGVNTLSVRGKERRVGQFTGRRPDWKKAIVTLREGERIEGIGQS